MTPSARNEASMFHWLRSPQVMLLIDRSSVYGRELIEGIGRYPASD
jgi:hypothetical protein